MDEKQLFRTTLDFFQMPPSEEQYRLLKQICSFYFNGNSTSIFLLNGYAGTGKTSLLSAFVKALFHQKAKTVLLAPTGRAAKVFSKKSGQLAFTIHKKIYRRENIPSGGIRLNLAPNLHTHTLFLVDEASMIGDYSMKDDGSINPRNLLEDLVNYVYHGTGCKMIFIGDIGQLPPVGSNFSPALDKGYMTHHYPQLTIEYFQLKQVLRQSEDSSILKNATLLRSAVQKNYPQFENVNQNDLFRLNGADLKDELDTAYNVSGIEETILITRSNKRANLFNQEIRATLFYYEEDIVSQDLLMVVRNNYFWLGSESNAGFIANGETIEVERIINRETKYGFHFVDARVKLIDYPELDSFKVKLLTNVLYTETPNLPREAMKALFFEVENDYAYERNKKKRYELIMNDPYFNALQVKYGYAVTCHKSQGGQWENVFVDQGFLNEDLLDSSYFRWLYTAFTRASKKLYLVNFAPQFFKKDLTE